MPIDPVPGIAITADGAGWGVNPTGSDFPFRLPSLDIIGLLTDVLLTLDSITTHTGPFRIAWIAGLNAALGHPDTAAIGPYVPTHQVDVVIVDATDTVVFDSTTATNFSARNFGDGLRIYSWFTTTASCVIVQRVGWPTTAPTGVPSEIVPTAGELDAECVVIAPKHVRTLTIGGTAANPLPTIVAGYNMTIGVNETTVGRSRRAQLTFDLAPGAGVGRAPGCEDDARYIRTIAGQAGDAHGNINLSGDGCTWVRPFIATSSRPSGTYVARNALAGLLVGDNCPPCRKNEEFEQTQLGIVTTWNAFATVRDATDLVIADLNTMAERWNAAKTCRESQSVVMNAIAHDGRYIDVAIGLCNHSDACIDNVAVRLSVTLPGGYTVETPDAQAVISDGKGSYQRYTVETYIGQFVAYWDRVGAQTSVVVRFRVKVNPAPSVMITVGLLAEAWSGGLDADPLPGTATLSITLP